MWVLLAGGHCYAVKEALASTYPQYRKSAEAATPPVKPVSRKVYGRVLGDKAFIAQKKVLTLTLTLTLTTTLTPTHTNRFTHAHTPTRSQDHCMCTDCLRVGWTGIFERGRELIAILDSLPVWSHKPGADDGGNMSKRLEALWTFLRLRLARHMSVEDKVRDPTLTLTLTLTNPNRLAPTACSVAWGVWATNA